MDESLEVPLTGGWMTEGVVRIGQTVRRPRGTNAELVQRLLGDLERTGFDASPRYLGVDEQGRDILDYVDGWVPSDCGGIAWPDAQLTAAMTLLRRFHDATAGSELTAGQEVVCHGDFSPWNLVWVDDRPVSIIDFDNASPGPRLDDLGYAVWKHLNLGLLPLAPYEQARRIRLAATAYEVEADADIVAAVDCAQQRMEDTYPGLVQLRRERAWLRDNATALRSLIAGSG
jgi:Ser/Thr protein kinase RdoA (MazF antagonist)